MKLPVKKPGIARLIFVALLILFNWPALSIPEPRNLFGWLFAAWGLAIALLFLGARRNTEADEADATLSAAGPEQAGPDGEEKRV